MLSDFTRKNSIWLLIDLFNRFLDLKVIFNVEFPISFIKLILNLLKGNKFMEGKCSLKLLF